MKDENEEIKEMFALYRSLIFAIQGIEKTIVSLVIVSEKITKSRFDELFFEKSQFTLGQLKRELKEKNIFNEYEMKKIDEFHSIRDILVHSFWWDRAIEFIKSDLRESIFLELKDIEIKFQWVDDLVTQKSVKILEEAQIDLYEIEEELLQNSTTPIKETFRKLKSDETLIDLKQYELHKQSIIPLFTLEDGTTWTVCESGLTQFKFPVDSSKLIDIPNIQDIFPIKQFNPKPKRKLDWYYDLDLKKRGLVMKITPFTMDGTISFRWALNNSKK